MWRRLKAQATGTSMVAAALLLTGVVGAGLLLAAKPPPAGPPASPISFRITMLGLLPGEEANYPESMNQHGEISVGGGVSVYLPAPAVGLPAGLHSLKSLLPSTGLADPKQMTFGPDGNLYVASASSNEVLVYDGTTGVPLGAFVSAGSGGLDIAHGLAFGSDGHLYVTSRNTNEVLRYDGVTGDFLSVFVSAGSGGVSDPISFVFGPDDNGDEVPDMYLVSRFTHEVLVYSGPGAMDEGAFLGALFPVNTAWVEEPFGLTIGADGCLYITSFGADNVVKYNFGTETLTVFVASASGGLDNPRHLTFGPDGKLYVAGGDLHNVFRYHADGSFDKVFVTAGSGGLITAIDVMFDSAGHLLVTSRDSDQILVYQGPGGADPGAFIDSYVPGTIEASAWTMFDATGINDSRQIVGGVSSELGYPSTGYRLNPPAAVGGLWTRDILPIPSGFVRAKANEINSAGDVVGDVWDAAGKIQACLWAADGTVLALGFLDGRQTHAQAINDSLQICGTAHENSGAYYRAWRWDAGVFKKLSNNKAAASFAINENGDVVGDMIAGSARHAFKYTSATNTFSDLGTLGGANSGATGINDNGEVYGYSQLSNGSQHLFLYTPVNGVLKMTDIYPSIVNPQACPAIAAGRLDARRINNSRFMCGVADNTGTSPPGTLKQGFLLTPVP